MSKQHHILYCTVCVPTSRYYIGAHSTNDLNDEYLGSGQLIQQSIRKHGSEVHVREVLEVFPDRESLMAREAAVIAQLGDDKNCMNLTIRGQETKRIALEDPDSVRDLKIRNLPDEVWDRLRSARKRTGTIMSVIVTRALEAELDRMEPQS